MSSIFEGCDPNSYVFGVADVFFSFLVWLFVHVIVPSVVRISFVCWLFAVICGLLSYVDAVLLFGVFALGWIIFRKFANLSACFPKCFKCRENKGASAIF